MQGGRAILVSWGSLLLVACAGLGALGPPRPAAAPAQSSPAAVPATPGLYLFRGATVMSAAGPSLPVGDLLIRDGRVAALAESLAPPPDAAVIDARGRFITPGLIDPHSHMGVYPAPRVVAHADGNEATHPLTPEVSALESFWPQDPALRRALAGGVTTIHVLPGSANLVGGQGVTLRPLRALSAREMLLPGAPVTMKMACGENPKRVHGGASKRAPATRMKEVAMLRQALAGARAYEPKGAPDYGKEALRRVITGEILIQNHCYRADEMKLRLDLFREFEVVPRAFHHAVEAYKIRHELAAAGVGAVVWADWWGSKLEMLDAVPAGAALLDEAGVRVSLHSDSAMDVQRLNQQAAVAMAAGRRAGVPVDRDRALRWITANPAWVLGIDDQVGTLEVGKRADVVVWSGDPFSVYSRAELVLIDGETVFDVRDPGLTPPSDFELGAEPLG